MNWFWIIIGIPGFIVVAFIVFLVLSSSMEGLIEEIKKIFK
jgi:hypothetical protein